MPSARHSACTPAGDPTHGETCHLRRMNEHETARSNRAGSRRASPISITHDFVISYLIDATRLGVSAAPQSCDKSAEWSFALMVEDAAAADDRPIRRFHGELGSTATRCACDYRRRSPGGRRGALEDRTTMLLPACRRATSGVILVCRRPRCRRFDTDWASPSYAPVKSGRSVNHLLHFADTRPPAPAARRELAALSTLLSR